ncbi:MAG TPA: hypothetical protein ENN97_05335 [Phycisphaerales bacterium]|nr:hypothetical protein [Phycisphaerales bacterium]
MKLNIKAFGLTCGIVWGLGLFFLTWWIIAFEGSDSGATFLSRVYRGYTITPVGSLVGLVWGAIDGWIGGLIFAWVYNALADVCQRKSRTDTSAQAS